jgi:hypothetical protein
MGRTARIASSLYAVDDASTAPHDGTLIWLRCRSEAAPIVGDWSRAFIGWVACHEAIPLVRHDATGWEPIVAPRLSSTLQRVWPIVTRAREQSACAASRAMELIPFEPAHGT